MFDIVLLLLAPLPISHHHWSLFYPYFHPDHRKLPLIHFHNFPPQVDLSPALQGHFTMKFSLQTSPAPHTK